MILRKSPCHWFVPAVLGFFLTPLCAAPAAPHADPLGRGDPRSAVTGFLQACRGRDFQKASEYLDLRQLTANDRGKGPQLARQLETILNSVSQFNVSNLSRNAEGDMSDPQHPNRQHVATIPQNGRSIRLDLERVTLQNGGPQVWLFSNDTVAAIPNIHTSTISFIEQYLPPLLVSVRFLETPLWKWIVLVLLALLMISVSRLLDWLLALLVKVPAQRLTKLANVPWVNVVIEPVRVMLCLAVFRIGVEIIDPSAIARLYIGRGIEMLLVWSVAWCLVRLVDLFVNHLDMKLDTPQKLASRTMLRLGRRTATVTISVFAILLILQNWGYNTSTLIAGLGVGGIAVALAAQQTVANVFGGVSLIGDHPIRIGEFGKFGDMQGVVEDIGMRSTRVRTLNRTLVSVPNSNFAGLNLENYSVRDKILFNPTFHIKRSTPDDQVHAVMDGIDKLLSSRKDLEPVATPARLVALAADSYSLEIFCYVLTSDIDEFYRIQSDLLLALNDVFSNFHIELA